MRDKALAIILAISFVCFGTNAWASGGPQPEPEESEENPTINPLDDAIAGPRRRTRRRRVYRRSYRPHYHTRSRVVVAHQSTEPVRSRPTVVSRPKRDAKMSIGLRFLAINIEDTQLATETFEGATLGGIGGYLRAKVDKHWGVEISADILGTSERAYDQLSIPVMVALMAHLFPESTLDLYGLAGGGVMFTEIDYSPSASGTACKESYTQGGAQLGGGVEIDLGALELIADLRWLFMQARPERADSIQSSAPLGEQVTQEADDFTNGLQFTLGVGGNF